MKILAEKKPYFLLAAVLCLDYHPKPYKVRGV